jgi:tetratricopeptide (TPR) repeat protein
LEDLNKVVLESYNAFILKSHGIVKKLFRDYQRALEDFHKANVLEPNDAFTLKSCGIFKKMFKDYQEVLEDFHEVDVFELNSALI